MLTSEVLHKAADLIEERGWTKGQGWPDEPGHSGLLCLEGGIMAALGDTWDDAAGYNRLVRCPAYKAVQSYLDGAIPFLWNDGARRNADEVIEVLRATAEVEALKEAPTLRGMPTPADEPVHFPAQRGGGGE